MGQRFRAGGAGDALRAPLPERAAGRGEGHANDFDGVTAAQRLEDRIVLGIERQQPRAEALHRLHDGVARADQRLLIGQRDRPALADRGERRRKADRAHDPRNDEVRRPPRRLQHRIFARGDFDLPTGDAGLQVGITRGVRDRGELRAQRDRRARERGAVAPADDGLDRETLRRGRDHLRAGPPDRACGAEQYEPLRSGRAGRAGSLHVITIETILPRSRSPTNAFRPGSRRRRSPR